MKKGRAEILPALGGPAKSPGVSVCTYLPELEAEACGCELALGMLT